MHTKALYATEGGFPLHAASRQAANTSRGVSPVA
jgi:hypothetical protein